jgi:hypothetical protein
MTPTDCSPEQFDIASLYSLEHISQTYGAISRIFVIVTAKVDVGNKC